MGCTHCHRKMSYPAWRGLYQPVLAIRCRRSRGCHQLALMLHLSTVTAPSLFSGSGVTMLVVKGLWLELMTRPSASC
jgi:hypothetical protein